MTEGMELTVQPPRNPENSHGIQGGFLDNSGIYLSSGMESISFSMIIFFTYTSKLRLQIREKSCRYARSSSGASVKESMALA